MPEPTTASQIIKAIVLAQGGKVLGDPFAARSGRDPELAKPPAPAPPPMR